MLAKVASALILLGTQEDVADVPSQDLKAGARVEILEYAGGHGWRGPVFDDISKGIDWLEKNVPGR